MAEQVISERARQAAKQCKQAYFAWHSGDEDGFSDATESIIQAAIASETESLLTVLKDAAAFFEKGHALDKMNWGASCLSAENIQELNELPLKIRAALAKAGRL